MTTGLHIRRLRGLVMAAAVVALAACTEVGPDYVRPSTEVPAAYKEAPAQAAQRHGSVPVSQAWWTVYGDPVLDALVARIGVDSPSLAAAAARVREARQLVRVAHGASVPAIGIGTMKTGRKNENDFGIGISWELDLWGRIRRDVEAHRASAEASADDLAAATLSMQAQAVQSYFALREDDAVIDLLQRAVTVDTQWLRMVRNQHAQGIVSSAEVAQALARLSTVQTQLAQTQSARAQFEHALAVMLGKPPAEFSMAPAAFDTEVPVIPAGLPSRLLQRRPDIAASERRMAAASARIGVSKAETLPSVNLAAGIGVLKGLLGSADIHAPLYAGGRLKAQVAGAREAYAEAVANYRQTVLDAFREVEDSLVAANTLRRAAGLQTMAADAANESARVARNQYRQGVADYQAVVEAAAARLDARQAELRLRLRRLDTSVDLIKALGGGWQAAGNGRDVAAEASQARSQPASDTPGTVSSRTP